MTDLKVFPYGPLASNMYILSTDSGIFIVDPSVYPDRLKESDIPSKVDYILITHGHFDHINAVDEWSRMYPEAEVYISSDDMDALTDPEKNGSSYFAEKCNYETVPLSIDDLEFDGLTVIKTPGHSKGSVCFLFEIDGKKIMFTGDTLFAGSCGRTDLPGGNSAQIMSSLRLLSGLDPSIKVFPGHGPSSTIAIELASNPFFNF